MKKPLTSLKPKNGWRRFMKRAAVRMMRFVCGSRSSQNVLTTRKRLRRRRGSSFPLLAHQTRHRQSDSDFSVQRLLVSVIGGDEGFGILLKVFVSYRLALVFCPVIICQLRIREVEFRAIHSVFQFLQFFRSWWSLLGHCFLNPIIIRNSARYRSRSVPNSFSSTWRICVLSRVTHFGRRTISGGKSGAKASRRTCFISRPLSSL